MLGVGFILDGVDIALDEADGEKRLRNFRGCGASNVVECSNGSSMLKMVPFPSSLATVI